MIYSCMGCKKRRPGCHDYCEDYAKDLAKNNERKDKIRKAKKEEDEYFLSTHNRRNKGNRH